MLMRKDKVRKRDERVGRGGRILRGDTPSDEKCGPFLGRC